MSARVWIRIPRIVEYRAAAHQVGGPEMECWRFRWTDTPRPNRGAFRLATVERGTRAWLQSDSLMATPFVMAIGAGGASWFEAMI